MEPLLGVAHKVGELGQRLVAGGLPSTRPNFVASEDEPTSVAGRHFNFLTHFWPAERVAAGTVQLREA